MLLAEGDRIPVNDDEEQPDDRIALLPTAPEDLGQETWRVDLTGANGRCASRELVENLVH